MEINMQEGEGFERKANKPVIHINENGARSYLWIGNDAEGDKFCFATLSGVKTLEKLACGILRAIGHNPAQIKKTIYNKVQPPTTKTKNK